MTFKACFVLILAMSPAPLFAGETMVTQTTTQTIHHSTTCTFRVDKCETSVATDPSYFRFKDGQPPLASSNTGSAGGVASSYQPIFTFRDYASQPPTVEELVTVIRTELSNCPEVTMKYDEDTGDITVH